VNLPTNVNESIVIVGGGLTAAKAAEALRAEGFAGAVAVFAAEDHLPYERPPLSKGYLQGTDDAGATIPLPQQWYADNDVALHTGTRVDAVDAAAHTVTVGGETVRYDRLLLATGAQPRTFRAPGAGLAGVHTLRSIDDSTALREAIKDGGRKVVLVGAGWIGLEVAAAAKTYGNEVTVLAPESVPLEAALGIELGEVFASLHRDNGVNLRMGVGVSAIRGTDRADGVVLGTGEEIDADVVVVGIGAIPDTALAEAAGLTVDNGIVTDSGFHTSDADIFAAGDVASVFHPVLGTHLRIEHWANALNQGAAVGRALAGASVEYTEIPYFYTDQFDLGMEYSGYAPLAKGAEVVIRGDKAGREFIAFWVAEGRVVAGMNVNVWDVNETVQALIRAGSASSARPIDIVALADPSVDLASLIPSEAP
jgi:3-phenylpropionate/trans-cinnamate dioxygenase ferredoxin reductase subunit